MYGGFLLFHVVSTVSNLSLLHIRIKDMLDFAVAEVQKIGQFSHKSKLTYLWTSATAKLSISLISI